MAAKVTKRAARKRPDVGGAAPPVAPVATPATPATPSAAPEHPIGSAAYWAAEHAQLTEARARCTPTMTAYTTLSVSIREAARSYQAALAAEPKPPEQDPADEDPASYRARLEVAAQAMTSQELEVFAAELLRRHGHGLTCDPRTGRLSLAPLGGVA